MFIYTRPRGSIVHSSYSAIPLYRSIWYETNLDPTLERSRRLHLGPPPPLPNPSAAAPHGAGLGAVDTLRSISMISAGGCATRTQGSSAMIGCPVSLFSDLLIGFLF
jgi:hypothetical protein